MIGGRDRVFLDLENERQRQDRKWGEQHHPDGTAEDNEILADDMRDRCEAAFGLDGGTWAHILTEEFFEAMAEEDAGKLRTELIHVAAVCVGWIEDIDSREAPNV